MPSTEMYEKMLLIRVLEEELQKLCLLGEAGDLHFSKGQEAISVGAMAALRETDYVVAHHRTIAHAVAKGVPLYPLVCEILGKADGINGGMAGEMHLSHPESRFMFSFQLVGTCVPVAAGIAWAVKNYKKTDDIVVVFHGDAATSNGQWHEGMNLAAVQKVPLLVICENNHLAGNIGPEYYQPVKSMIRRVAGYGMDCDSIDGNNVNDVMEAVEAYSYYVRVKSKPFFLECDTTRLSRHKQGQGDIRTKEEIEKLAERDPLLRMEGSLEMASRVEVQVRAVIERAQAAPNPA